MYADDIVLLAETGDELQEMLDVVGHYAQEWRFRFNAQKSKTRYMHAHDVPHAEQKLWQSVVLTKSSILRT